MADPLLGVGMPGLRLRQRSRRFYLGVLAVAGYIVAGVVAIVLIERPWVLPAWNVGVWLSYAVCGCYLRERRYAATGLTVAAVFGLLAALLWLRG